jgi:hypothetical protein
MKTESLNEKQYKEDVTSITLFEDKHSFSFSKITVSDVSLKFSWNSRGIQPGILTLESLHLIFVGVDTYTVGYNYETKEIVFFLRTGTNFKWFDIILNGIAIVTETGVILLNTFERCTLKACFFFADIITGTKVDKGNMKVSFLVDNYEIVRI